MSNYLPLVVLNVCFTAAESKSFHSPWNFKILVASEVAQAMMSDARILPMRPVKPSRSTGALSDAAARLRRAPGRPPRFGRATPWAAADEVWKMLTEDLPARALRG